MRQRIERLLLGGLPRRLPWQDEPATFYRVGLVPLLFYRLRLYEIGWSTDRLMRKAMK